MTSQQEVNSNYINNYKLINKCRCCSSDVKLILDLNDQPLANTYHDKINELDLYPLNLYLCVQCFHLQLGIVVNPELMFKNYLYVSGTSNTLKKYFDFFSNFVYERFININNFNPSNILDIACNDGSQLDFFKQLGLETFGIDPAENLFEYSSKNHNVICDFFPSDKINNSYDLIIAQNVFAHTDDISSFLLKCHETLNDKGVLYIQTSQANMVHNCEFDTIYHEHLSFFNTLSMKTILEKCKLHLINVYKFDIHGCSYIFEISKQKINGNVDDIILDERKNGLFNFQTYERFSEKANFIINSLSNTINEYRNDGFKIVGYGAAAKGMTVLNFGKIYMDVIIDDNYLKHDLYTPGTNILIKGNEYLKSVDKNDKILFVPLAWNFYSEIYLKIKNIRNNDNDRFLLYFPDLSISS